ncbi:hypothetical protein EJ06DRAFT_529357 [Trichodelitschia bisporula]|uniref:Uncharacterized protein n=1 Tax=Trichodelitschia bisporula TaxID=703511 RepID=A0A6G1HZ60_9PEZI|nr:hypothetical protein EJ06DRAFT_529357 [Trichodelitschia bisporula]
MAASLAAAGPNLQRRLLLRYASRPTSIQHFRAASSKSGKASLKPLVLEKPDKFRPPSHASRPRNAAPRAFPGPPLSKEELEAQKTKKYPHMMPPEGTFMHWFLTNRMLHAYISMSVLVFLAVFMLLAEFHSKNKFPELVPPKSIFFTSPLQYLSQYIHVYKLHTEALSAETAEKRRKQVEDARKRAEYRRVHGMENEGGLGGWTGLGEERPAVAGAHEGGDLEGEVEERRPKKPLRKWFGIW